MRDKTNKMDQNMDFCVLVFFDIMDNALQNVNMHCYFVAIYNTCSQSNSGGSVLGLRVRLATSI